MSFIDDSENNVNRLMKEVSGGGIAGFVGRAGSAVDQLFAGAFHPDSGHGSKNKQLLDKQLKDRRKLRKDIESNRDGVIDDYSGLADPIGGYYNLNDQDIDPAYEELDMIAQSNMNFNINNTPEQDLEWVEVVTDLEYDENPTYAGENFINQSETNWEYINRGDK